MHLLPLTYIRAGVLAGFDQPLTFHPVAVSVSIIDTLFGAGCATGLSAEPSSRGRQKAG